MLNSCQAGSPKGRRYSPEWLLNCLLLHIKSPATYNMLRDQGFLPLPCKSTITKYLRNSNVGVGFDDNFFKLFEQKLRVICAQNAKAKYGILSFDKMQVKRALGVNLENMTFSGLVNYGSDIDFPEANKSDNLAPQNKIENLKDQQADHCLVFMFSSLGASFHQPIGMFA